ncbi:hypothetical protein QAD02_010002 [Eretmocerus hayati]|uniref:Uncharacterized protein n=1 Tax=Eretmocerus hayati TaxID=131215 RepID=A0ACC2NBA5_9HYME|nr:hypothetical protein QAD02_010002 [Eretmocerus hayati]
MDEGFVQASSENLPKVDLLMLVEFINSSDCFQGPEMQNVKTEKSMRPNYGDVAVGYVKLKRQQNKCILHAQICPEHKVKSPNYNVHVVIDEKKENVLEATCADCAASKGGCKHAVAVLAWLHRRSEEPAPTTVQCYWKKPALSSVGTTIKYLTISDMLAGKRTKNSEPDRTSRESDNKDFLRRIVHDARVKDTRSHLLRFCSLTVTQKLTLHYQSIVFTGNKNSVDEFLQACQQWLTPENCAHANKMTINQSSSVSWFQLRYGRITASLIWDAGRCKTPDGCLVEKILSKMDYDSPAMQRGRELEDQVLLRVGNHLTEKYNEIIEIKCPSKEETKKNYYDGNKIKSKYRAQLHVQMFFAGKTKGYFCIADPEFERNGKVVIAQEPFDKEFTMKVIDDAMTFWKNCIFPHLMKNS